MTNSPNWRSLTDEQVLDITKQLYAGYTPTQLIEEDSGLYVALRDRKLMRKTELHMRRDLSHLTRETFKEAVDKLGVKSKLELSVRDSGLYQKGRAKGWLTYAIPETRYRNFDGWNKKKFKKEMKMRNITSRKELIKLDSGLYTKALKMGWIEVLPKQRPTYDNFTRESFAAYCKKSNIQTRTELSKQQPGLYAKAQDEGWCDILGEPLHRTYKGWTRETFSAEMERVNVRGRKELYDYDQALYMKAKKMGWLDTFGAPKKTKRDYDGWTQELFNKKMKSDEIETHAELRKYDSGLYVKAKEMGWLEASHLSRSVRRYKGWSIEQFQEKIKEYGVTRRSALCQHDKGMYGYLLRMNLLDTLFPKNSLDDILGTYIGDSE